MDAAIRDLIREPDQLTRVMLAIEVAVSSSFQIDDARIIVPGVSAARTRITRAKVRERTEKCWDMVKVLRGDMGWSIARIIDHLSKYLRMYVDGIDWEPDARTSWTQTANAV